ncbi:MAG: lipase family protein [Flavisolibacter sp.]
MKRFFIGLLLCVAAMQSFSQTGKNCFNTKFHNTATTLDPVNAYLLGYLSTMVYPDYLRLWYPGVPGFGLKGDSVKAMQVSNDKFVRHYADNLGYLFVDRDQPATFTLAANTIPPVTNINTSITKTLAIAAPDPSVAVYSVPNGQRVSFDFESKCNTNGYNPEAVVISTPTTIFVVFRGTDRVECNVPGSFAYEWGEWIATDFQFAKRPASVMNVNIQGNVHRGMVESLLLHGFADSLASRVEKYGGANKKVWITGHSLGGAHAQLFAMFLKFNYGITAQGLYIYEAPHPGDQTFVNQLNSSIGKTHIQRFEFGDDPICTLPPQTFLYARAGERNYFKDYSTGNIRTEQNLADDAKILCVLGNLPGEQIPQAAQLSFPPTCPGSTCYHHPTFILKAVAHQLNSSDLAGLPPVVSLPVAGDACNVGDLNKAQDNDLFNNTATAVETTISNIVWSAVSAVENLATNLVGGGDGNYKIACYGFKDNSKKYLNWNGTIGSQLKVSTTGTVFTFTKKFTGGYRISKDNGNMSADVTFNFGLPSGDEKTDNIIMRENDNIVGDEETWYILKVPNANNTYVLYNWNTRKVLDANDNCLSANSCDVNEGSAKSNNGTQVWILEKVN